MRPGWAAPDGYRYGVMFSDGSIRQAWNGRTQRLHAEIVAERLAVEYPGDDITVARCLPGQSWVRL